MSAQEEIGPMMVGAGAVVWLDGEQPVWMDHEHDGEWLPLPMTLVEGIASLREALRWYADPDNMKAALAFVAPELWPLHLERMSERASTALAGIGEEEAAGSEVVADTNAEDTQ